MAHKPVPVEASRPTVGTFGVLERGLSGEVQRGSESPRRPKTELVKRGVGAI